MKTTKPLLNIASFTSRLIYPEERFSGTIWIGGPERQTTCWKNLCLCQESKWNFQIPKPLVYKIYWQS